MDISMKKECCNHRYPDSVYLHTLLLIIYLSAIERLICRREMSLIGSTSFGFEQNTIHDFQNTVLTSWWPCLRQMPQKTIGSFNFSTKEADGIDPRSDCKCCAV